jgi:hypothetical protein
MGISRNYSNSSSTSMLLIYLLRFFVHIDPMVLLSIV